MQISKKSWHFKLLDYYVIYPKNLCSYFWLVVFLSLIYPFDRAYKLLRIHVYLKYKVTKFWWNYILAPISISILSFYFLFGDSWMDSFPFSFGLPIAILISIGMLELVFLGLYFLVEFLCFIDKRKKEKEPKKPNLLFEYLKAKKQKICPLIEYKK